MTIGVIVMAYGSPNDLSEVADYLKDIRGGRDPSPEAVKELTGRYQQIGGSSPLNAMTHLQAEVLQTVLDERHPGIYRVFVGMKHWTPTVAEAVADVVTEGINEVVGIVLAPHYSSMSIGEYEKRLQDASSTHVVDARMVHSWYEQPRFVELVADNLSAAMHGWDPSEEGTTVFFTAHSLPQSILEHDDPYPQELTGSAKLIADAAGIARWEFAYQSASATGTPWLGPDILESLESFARSGGRRAVIAPIGFVSDHLEILYDVDIECVNKAAELGIELRRIASPNADRRLMEAMADAIASMEQDAA